jgi:phenylalanyl-tRNA synthetase beta chain
MRVPLAWLHEHCAPSLDAAALAERLALTGTEVERVAHHGVPSAEGFVIGKVLAAEQHPDADRLRVCRVDLGEDEPAQIVCGAPNVAAGQTVAVATPGAVMPDGTKLGKAKLRGVVSAGMILSEPELELGAEKGGIMVLPATIGAPGTPLGDVLPIATDVLELEITPNRPDCLGVYGVAREVHAATGAPLGPAPWAEDPGSAGALAGIEVAVETARCPRFTARVFEDVTIGPSPTWLKARLMAAGQRPISNVVDITNYVMLLTGQPLHAFDLDRVAGGRLVVRDGRPGDELETLDGERRALDPDMVVICDDDGPTSLAGVMGGARSEVHDGTSRVLMEAATWDGPNIQRTSTRLGLRSEASARFEKGLAPEQTLEAQAVATKLMIELCGARVEPGTLDVAGPAGWDASHATIRLRDARVQGLLGAPIARERSAEILTALGFVVRVADAGDGLDVTVPHFRRNDVTREADLIEEVARIDGVDQLPATLPARHEAVGHLTPAQQLRRKAADALAAAGLHEIVGWSWSQPDLDARLRLAPDDVRRHAVTVENPMSADQGRMRTTLLGSLLDVARRNVTHGTREVAIFEAGAVYLPGEDGLAREPQYVGALLTGAARPAGWREPSPPVADFFAAKGVLAHLLGALRVGWHVERAAEPFLHPGRAAAIVLDGGARIGWLGELHPSVAAGWELDGAVAAFELDLDAALAAVPGPVRYADYTSFPEVRQDLAVVVGVDVPAGDVVATVREAGGPLLAAAEVFDVYRGEQLGEGEVSLALRLAFRSPERTLTDEEVAERRAAIEAALAERVGGRIRA